MKNKSNLIIIIFSVIIVIIISYILYQNYQRNKVEFYLNGEEQITLDYGGTYQELGFVAKNGLGDDLSNNVIVQNNINNLQPGGYKVTYELNYNDETLYLTRVVFIKDMDMSNLELRLNGEKEVYLIKGEEYNEEGAYVFNKLTNSNFDKGSITTNGDVNTLATGKYEITYTFVYNGKSMMETRIVQVADIIYNITPETITTGKVNIFIDLNSLGNYLNTKLPDGATSDSKTINYEVSKNGEYQFTIVTNNNKEYPRTITISNIIANYTCTGEITGTGTKLTVNPKTEDVKEYEWVVNGLTTKGSNTFSQNKIINSAYVNVIFKDNQKYKVNCKITDKLVYHFKYDVSNTKPFMKCNTYTAQDKARLDAKLAQVVNEAGRGSRAGVVAAARFLVGGLDYKVPYEGGVYYNKGGLNIGQNGAWGCSGKGLDCYSFVAWARAQNGLPDDGFYNGSKQNTAGDAANIKVGDYLLTPCSSSSCKNANKINHIGLVIGIDENYLYVAEETTGNINALVVTRLARNNLPRSGGFSLVRHVNYPSEGNVTNMWIS